jgi:hypothetical protein
MDHLFKNLIKTLLILISLLLQQYTYPQLYLDPSLPVKKRVQNLLSVMTLEEKVGQMTQAERGSVVNSLYIATHSSIVFGIGVLPPPLNTDPRKYC